MKVVLESLDIQPVIYGIKCKVNNKIYVGKAKNYFSRFALHLRDLQLRKHHCKLLQSDFDLYGKKNFQLLILRELQAGEDIDFLEIEEISKIDSTLLYNSNLVENKVISYNPATGEILKVYFNISDASKQTNIPFINIKLCCSHYKSSKTAKNIGFILEKDKDKIQERLIDNRGKHLNNTTSVVQINKETKHEIKTFESIRRAMLETGVYEGNISACCRGNRKSSGGFIWRYA